MQLPDQAIRDITDALSRNFTQSGRWMTWGERSTRVAVILGGAWILTRVFRMLLKRLRHQAAKTMDKRGGATEMELEKRSITITSVVGKVVTTLVWLIAGMMTLNELTFNVQPLIAGLGIVGLAVGLGAQTLIKDWLGGLFMLLEDQIRIGDSVSINHIHGTVEEINLRTTVLRSENGAVHVIPNGGITQLSNFTREYSYYVFETTIAHGANVGKALEILDEIGAELLADDAFEPLILGPLEVMGIQKLSERGVSIGARIKTLPSKQVLIGREFNRRVKARFDGEGIGFQNTPGAA